MKTKINIFHIALCTLLFNIIIGIPAYLFFYGIPIILPVIIIPFPALLYRLCMYNRAKSLNYILTVAGFAVSIIVINLLVYLLYFILEYSKDQLPFIMWGYTICYISAMTMLSFAVLIPLYHSKFPNRIMIVVSYTCADVLMLLLAIAAYCMIEYLKISYITILIFSVIVLGISTAISMLLHKKALSRNRSKKKV